VIGCEDRLRNDYRPYCVEWGVKLYSNQTKPERHKHPSMLAALTTKRYNTSTQMHKKHKKEEKHSQSSSSSDIFKVAQSVKTVARTTVLEGR